MSRAHTSAPGRRPSGPGCLATEDGIMGLKERGAITGIGETAVAQEPLPQPLAIPPAYRGGEGLSEGFGYGEEWGRVGRNCSDAGAVNGLISPTIPPGNPTSQRGESGAEKKKSGGCGD